jgi:hypothetical protein
VYLIQRNSVKTYKVQLLGGQTSPNMISYYNRSSCWDAPMDAGLSSYYGWILSGPQQDTSLGEKGKEQRYRKGGEKVSQIFSHFQSDSLVL